MSNRDRTEDFADYTDEQLMAVLASIPMLQPIKRGKR
jgi:hypothetical protein